MTTEPTSRRRRRPHPAIGARIAATGLGATGVLALTAVMAAAETLPAPAPAEPAVAGVLGGPAAAPDVPATAPGDAAAVAPTPLTPMPVSPRVVVPDPGAGTSQSSPAPSVGSGSGTVSPSRPRTTMPPAATTRGSR